MLDLMSTSIRFKKIRFEAYTCATCSRDVSKILKKLELGLHQLLKSYGKTSDAEHNSLSLWWKKCKMTQYGRVGT